MRILRRPALVAFTFVAGLLLAGAAFAAAPDDWGFDLRRIRSKTLLVYGGEDPVAGAAHGRWYRHRIKGAKLRVVPHAGHLVIVDAWRDVLEHLAPDEV